ncbi:MAG: carbon-nitrogen hydrolase family protein, partial [Bacteroidota bacterium]
MQHQDQVKVGIVQERPAYLDLHKSLQKAARLCSDAAKQDVDLLVFGETWLCGYPAWIDYLPNIALWDYEPTAQVFLEMLENGVEIPGKAIDQIGQMAADYQMHIVMGVNERVRQGAGQGTLYNTLLIFDKEGHLVVHHRKLMPTYTEKLLYGTGDGHGLQSVETPFGKLGALICWEHWMPLTRQTMHNAGEIIHIALWPAVKDLHQLASRHYAFESQSFVIAVGQILQVKDLPSTLQLPEDLANTPERFLLNGGSSIIGPDSAYILE